MHIPCHMLILDVIFLGIKKELMHGYCIIYTPCGLGGIGIKASVERKKLITCLEGEKMAGIVVVFDFDKTIIDVDSDNWVVDELGATDLFNQLLPTMPWNSLMVSCVDFFIINSVLVSVGELDYPQCSLVNVVQDRMMKELHSQGKTIDDIAEVLKRVPIHPRAVPAIKSAHALGYIYFHLFSFQLLGTKLFSLGR